MLVLLNIQDFDLIRFEFAEPLELSRTPEEHLAWVLEDYPARQIEMWRVPPVPGNGVLLKMMSEKLLSGAPFDPVPIIVALGDYGNSGFSPPLLQTFLDDARVEVRLAAIRALGQMRHDGSVLRLLALLVDPDPRIAHEALVALAKRIDEASLNQAEEIALRDPEMPRLLHAARERSAAIRDEDAQRYIDVTLATPEFRADLQAIALPFRNQLRAALADESRPESIRLDVALALGARFDAGPELVRLAAHILHSPATSIELRLAVLWMLGRGGRQNRQAVPLLCDLLDAPELGLQRAAIEALGQIGQRAALGPLLNASEREATRSSVRLALRRLGRALTDAEYREFAESRWLPNLIASYGFGDDERLASPANLEAIARGLQSDSTVARREAAFLLGLLGSAEQAPALRSLAISEADELTHTVAARAAFLARGRG